VSLNWANRNIRVCSGIRFQTSISDRAFDNIVERSVVALDRTFDSMAKRSLKSLRSLVRWYTERLIVQPNVRLKP